MLLWILVLFLYLVPRSNFKVVKDSANPLKVLNAFVGDLFELSAPLVESNLSNLPSWICHYSTNHSFYQGISLERHAGTYYLKEYLAITVAKHGKFLFHTRCKHRWPTILVLLSNHSISSSACERTSLWNKASQFLPEEMAFIEDTEALSRTLLVLSQWPRWYNGSTKSIIAYFMGCGSIPDSRLSTLKFLEQQSNIDILSEQMNHSIASWIIADLHDPIARRRRRENSAFNRAQYSLSRSSIFYSYEKRQRQEWPQGRVIIEGSGLNDQPFENMSMEMSTRVPTTRASPISLGTPKKIQYNRVPFVNQGLKNMTVVIGTRLRYQILPETFFDREDGYADKMTLKVYIRLQGSHTDCRMTGDARQWIYYTPGRQVMVVQPGKGDSGVHNLVVCVYDSQKNRACNGTTVSVRIADPVTETSYMNAPAGVLWKYVLQGKWATVVNASEKDKVTVAVKGPSVFEWSADTSTISLITEAYISREHQITIDAESADTGQKFTWTMIVISVGHNTYVTATSVEIIVQLIPIQFRKVPFDIINLMKEKLILAIAPQSRNAYSTARDILVFKILDGRGALMANSSDKSLRVSFVYAPKQSSRGSGAEVACEDVIITNEQLRLLRVSLSGSSSFWRLEDLNLESISGKCQQDLTSYKESYAVPPIANLSARETNHDDLPSWLNRTLNITVWNGFTFKKIVVFPSQSEYKLIHKMELRDENNLVCDDSSWVSLSTQEFALHGLPLLENVRHQPYNFRLDVILKSGATQLVSVVISVEKFTPQFQHIFEIAISISESDTVAHSSSMATGFLALSHTLFYRWLLVQTLGSYLQSGRCLAHCGIDIFTHQLSENRSWLVNFSWSMLLGPPDSTTPGSQTACNYSQLQTLIRSLFVSDSTAASILSAVPSPIANFSAKPNDALIKSFISRHLGTPTLVTALLFSPCSSSYQDNLSRNSSSGLWLNITVLEGSLFAASLTSPKSVNRTSPQRTTKTRIYFKNDTVCNLRWLKLGPDGDVLYGLPLSMDMVHTSTVLLRIEIVLDGTTASNISLKITVVANSENSHLIAMRLKLTVVPPLETFELRTRVVQLLHQYLQPSCSLIGNYGSPKGSRFLDAMTDELTLRLSCEKAENVVLHHLAVTTQNGQATLAIDLSLRLCQANKSVCDIDSVSAMNGEFFENSSTKAVSQDLVQFFSHTDFGVVENVEICLHMECLHHIQSGTTDHDWITCPRKDLPVKQSSASSQTSKTVLLVLFLVIVVAVCLCLGAFFAKKTLLGATSKLKSNGNKDVNSSDQTKETKNSIKSPLPSLKKKPKNLVTQESSYASAVNNSPSSPLLQPVLRDDHKSDRHNESVFGNEDTTGSYSFAASRTKSPLELELGSSSAEAGLPMCAVKQPNTSNVIRNPAMMMGSRLNPYRNIPPPI